MTLTSNTSINVRNAFKNSITLHYSINRHGRGNFQLVWSNLHLFWTKTRQVSIIKILHISKYCSYLCGRHVFDWKFHRIGHYNGLRRENWSFFSFNHLRYHLRAFGKLYLELSEDRSFEKKFVWNLWIKLWRKIQRS